MDVETVRPTGWTSRPASRWILAVLVALAAGAGGSLLGGFEHGKVAAKEPQSFYFQYRDLVWGTAGVMAALLLLVVGLAVNILRRRRAEAALESERAFLKSVTERLLDQGRQLEHTAHHDPLTGLPNRLLFLDRFRQAIARSHRSHNTVALLFLDLDRFKNVNDTLGHETGDALLREVAERLKASVRVEDTVARLGGDEFTILIEESRENPTGVAVARKIIQGLERPFSVGQHQLYAGASIGIAIFPVDGTSVERLIRNADAAMYLAKERGRGNYQFFTESLNEKAHRQLVLETRLRETLADGGLDLHYQPIVRLRDGKVVAAEALLRWTDPELGTVHPAEFIPVAEETGLIVPIGEAVLLKACLAATRWHENGFPEIRVAVNISARQFWHQDLPATVRQVLAESGLPARYLELELTESLLLPDSDAAVDVLQALRRPGIRLSLDDFGTGYSSLGYLKRLPFDDLKVAQTFVKDISVNPNDAAVVRAILSLSKTFGFQVTAEGVETRQHVDFFQTYGCDLAQGHYFSPAVPMAAFEELLRAQEDRPMFTWDDDAGPGRASHPEDFGSEKIP